MCLQDGDIGGHLRQQDHHYCFQLQAIIFVSPLKLWPTLSCQNPKNMEFIQVLRDTSKSPYFSPTYFPHTSQFILYQPFSNNLSSLPASFPVKLVTTSSLSPDSLSPSPVTLWKEFFLEKEGQEGVFLVLRGEESPRIVIILFYWQQYSRNRILLGNKKEQERERWFWKQVLKKKWAHMLTYPHVFKLQKVQKSTPWKISSLLCPQPLSPTV